MSKHAGTEWGFVIDTDSYSGNFNREVCGYVAGVDDGTHGGREAEVAREEIGEAMLEWLEDNVLFFPESNGFPRCAHLYPTAGWFNHGMGGHFRDGQEEEALEDHRKEVREYREQHPGALKGLDENVLKKCPAYMSVVIWFGKEPPGVALSLMAERARKWAGIEPDEDWKRDKPKITGFRLTRKTTTSDEVVEELRL